jgi:hypothetical protein
MHHQRIALNSLPLLQRQQPIWRLCRTRHNTRSRQCMRTMLFCHSTVKRCTEEMKIAPTNPTISAPIRHGVMASWHIAISWPQPVLKPFEQRVQTMNKLIVWFQHQARWADGAVNFCEGRRKNWCCYSNGNVAIGDWLVWGQFLDPNITQDTIGNLWSRVFDWCNENMVVFVWNHTNLIFKVLNSAGSMSFWLCPD